MSPDVNHSSRPRTYRMPTAFMAAAVLIALSAMLCLAQPSDSADAEIRGQGYQQYSPSGDYELSMIYYYNESTDTTVLEIMASFHGADPRTSEMGKSIWIYLCENDNDDTHERTIISRTTAPVRFDEDFGIKDITEEVLEDGIYYVQVRAYQGDLIAEQELIVGKLYRMTFVQPEEGSVSETEFLVPENTEISFEEPDLVFSFDEEVIRTVTAEPPEGCHVKGWTIDDEFITSRTVQSDLEISVVWEKDTVTITFDANGGTGTMDPVQVVPGTEYKLPASRFTPPSGMVFKSWTVGGKSYSPGNTIVVETDTTVRAVWEGSPTPPGPEPSSHTFTLSFDANGGTGAPETMKKTTTSSTYSFTIPADKPVRSGYDFKGWSDLGTVFQPGSSITLSETFPSKTLVAVWEESGAPDVDHFEMGIDYVSAPQGSSFPIPFDVEPPEAAPWIEWRSSDESVATVDHGVVTAVNEGTASISAYDSHGNRLGTVTVTVSPSSGKSVEETVQTLDGGSVTLVYGKDTMTPSGPITIDIGTSHSVTDDQAAIVVPFIERMIEAGSVPDVVIRTDSRVLVPAAVISAMAEGRGTLTAIEGDVTLQFPWEVLEALGYGEDLEFVVIPVEISEEPDIVIPDLPNVRAYEIYILEGEERVTVTFPKEVMVTIDYAMKEGWTPDRLSVWYLDVEPRAPVEFEYVKGEGVVFGVMHFSHYAVSYDDGSPSTGGGHCIWFWIMLVAMILIALFLLWFFLARRFTVTLDLGNGKMITIPDGWEADSDSVLVRRFRCNGRLEIPPISLGDGQAIQRWTPEPEERVKGSVTYAAVIGEREGLAPAEEPHEE